MEKTTVDINMSSIQGISEHSEGDKKDKQTTETPLEKFSEKIAERIEKEKPGYDRCERQEIKFQAERLSLQGKKDLLKSYRVNIEELKLDAKSKVSKKTILKDFFKITIASLLAITAVMSTLQFTEDNKVYKIIILITSIGNTILSAIFSTLSFEKEIIKFDKIARSCESLLLEMDRSIYTTKYIDDSEIDSLIAKIKQIINQTAIEIEIQPQHIQQSLQQRFATHGTLRSKQSVSFLRQT